MFRRASSGFKYAYTITFNSCSGLSNNALVNISWKRGTKKENQGETSRKIATEGTCEWDETIALKCTLFKAKTSLADSIRFDEKPMVISVCEYNMKKSKAVPLARLTVDLSAFAGVSSQTQYHKLKPIFKKKAEPGSSNDTIILSITYNSVSIGEVDGISETDNIEVNDMDKEDDDGVDPFADTEGKGAADKDKDKDAKSPKADPSGKKHEHSKHKSSGSSNGELSTLNDAVSALERNVESLSGELKAARAENTSLQRQVESLETSIKENGADEAQQALVETYKEKASESAAAAQVLRQDNTELRERVEKLEKDLKAAKAEGKKSGKKSKHQKGLPGEVESAEEVAALRAQVAALTRANAMTVALYECAVGALFCEDGDAAAAATATPTPRAAALMKEWLAEAGAFENPSESALYEPIFACARPLYNAASESYNTPFYWVSTYYALLGLVAGSDRLRPRIATQDDGADPQQQRGLVDAIEYELYESFLAALSNCYRHIDECVVFKDEGFAGELPKIRTQDIVGAIAASLRAAESVRLPGSVRVQVCEHLVACTDAGIFNELVSKPELCTCGMGLHIRETLGEIDDFLRRDSLMFQTKRLLAHVREAACLFIMDKNILNDDDAINSVICVLNYKQVTRLLENFHEDQFCTTPVDAPILQLMRGRARTSMSADIKLDPHKFFS